MFLTSFSQHVVNPIFDGLLNPKLRRYVAEVNSYLGLSRKQQQAVQLDRLRKVCSVAANTEYYSDIFATYRIKKPELISFEAFEQLPPLTKDVIRSSPKSLLPKGLSFEKLRKTATGGTTDAPVTFYMDWDCYIRRLAATRAFDAWHGYQPGKNIAYLWGASQDFPKVKKLRQQLRKALLERKTFLTSSPLNEAVMEKHYQELKRVPPVLLQAYPTPLTIFSRFLIARNYKLSIPVITCTAEPLLDYQKEIILQAFEQMPLEWYGSRECGRVATEKTAGQGMLVNTYNLLVETAQPNGNTPSNILISDLWNLGFPMLRYDTRDLGQLEEPLIEPLLNNASTEPKDFSQDRQFPVLKNIKGRVQDIFFGANNTIIPGVSLTNRVIKESSELQGLQIIQQGYDNFLVKIVPGDNYQAGQSQQRILKDLNEFLGHEVNLSVQVVQTIPREKSGKLRFCKNLMTPEEFEYRYSLALTQKN